MSRLTWGRSKDKRAESKCGRAVVQDLGLSRRTGLRLGWSAKVDGAWVAGNCGSLSGAKDAAQAVSANPAENKSRLSSITS